MDNPPLTFPPISMEPLAQTPPDPKTKTKPHKSRQNSNTESPSLDIEDHAAFWSAYDKVASNHDTELLDGWNKSLDILLIFAALFSAINTAFIIESYKGLKADPAEITNSLLRVLIVHRADNITLPDDILNPGSVDSSAVPVNSVFFASLSLSLTAAFGAVTAKQWLTEYRKIGSIRAIHKQCLARQQKFEGLETWRFHFLIELLPLLLQLSVLIFLVGVIQFVWALERRIAVMELVFSATGLALYLSTVLIAMIFPTSPFQTPLSKYMLQAFLWIFYVGREVGPRIRLLASSLSINYPLQHLRNCLEWCGDSLGKFLPTSTIDTINHGWKRLRRGVDNRYMHLMHREHLSTVRESKSWSSKDERAAATVFWLLEHSEHADITVAALDAALRLPGDLLLTLVNEQEGMKERLLLFHLNQTSLASDSRNPEWQDRAVLAQIALFHIFKLDPSSDYYPDLPSTYPIPIHVQAGGRSGHHGFEQLQTTVSESALTSNVVVKWSRPALINSDCDLLLQPRTLNLTLNIAKQNSITSNFISSVVPAHLALEALTCSILLGHIPPVSVSSMEDNKWKDMVLGLRNLLDAKPSWSTISHIALTVAAMLWTTPEGRTGRWCYTTIEQQINYERLLKRSIYASDKGGMVLHNVALALSLVDPYSHDLIFELLCGLLSLVEIEYRNILQSNNRHCRSLYPHLPESLLRLSRRNKGNTADQDTILRILGTYKGWICSSTADYVEEIIQLFDTKFRARLHDSTHSKQFLSDPSPLHQLTVDIMSTEDIQLFRGVFLLEDGVIARSYAIPSWVPIQPVYRAILSAPLKFGPPSPYFRECQVDVALRWLTRLHSSLETGDEEGRQGVEILAGFLKGVLTDFELELPRYYTTKLIKTMDYREQYQVQEDFIDHLKDHCLEHVWIGDMILMLWKAAHKARREWWLPNEWNDFEFFDLAVVDLMLFHEEHLVTESFEGVDNSTLKNYFKEALRFQSSASEGGRNELLDEYPSRRSSLATQEPSYNDQASDLQDSSQESEERYMMANLTAIKGHTDLHLRIKKALEGIDSRE
ncbi:hypothetical protein FRC02_001141 [Tulasnella sp. 418]|nr:hypothetical protein FRC02_001141 [Tulasnella sp. 418]